MQNSKELIYLSAVAQKLEFGVIPENKCGSGKNDGSICFEKYLQALET
jgi:hypothetical protein